MNPNRFIRDDNEWCSDKYNNINISEVWVCYNKKTVVRNVSESKRILQKSTPTHNIDADG